jgi:hypothetical protein
MQVRGTTSLPICWYYRWYEFDSHNRHTQRSNQADAATPTIMKQPKTASHFSIASRKLRQRQYNKYGNFKCVTVQTKFIKIQGVRSIQVLHPCLFAVRSW